MRDITVSLTEEIAEAAEALAIQRGVPLAALIADALTRFVGESSLDAADTWETEERLMATGCGMRIGAFEWDREGLHDRHL